MYLQSGNNGYMPIEQHPSLTPLDNTGRIWRYMDFPKYLSMLDKSSLYFCHVETLAQTDPHEGMLAQPNFRHRNWKELKDLSPLVRRSLIGGNGGFLYCSRSSLEAYDRLACACDWIPDGTLDARGPSSVRHSPNPSHL